MGERVEEGGFSPDDFFEEAEADRRFEIGLRACMYQPPADDDERSVRQDIYTRNEPTHGKR